MHRLRRAPRPLTGSWRHWLSAVVFRLGRAPVSGSGKVGGSRESQIPLDDLPSGGLRILVVDDDPSHLANAREMLARHGLTPIVAADGAEAVALASGYRFDLILMDLVLPVLDGLAATKQIRRDERQQNSARAPVLAYTNLHPEASVLRSCGVDGVLEKPCSDSALRECLIRWCVPKFGTEDEIRPATT